MKFLDKLVNRFTGQNRCYRIHIRYLYIGGLSDIYRALSHIGYPICHIQKYA
jgi:hypothetical protein